MSRPLKLIKPVEKPDPVKDYEPLFLSTVNLLDIYWGQVCEALAPCVDDAMHGEMTLDDIYNPTGGVPSVCTGIGGRSPAVRSPKLRLSSVAATGLNDPSEILSSTTECPEM